MEGLGQSKKEFKKAHQKMKPTEEDWALILKGARNQKLKKSDVIIKEGADFLSQCNINSIS